MSTSAARLSESLTLTRRTSLAFSPRPSLIVEDANGRPLAYVYFEDEPVRRGLTKRLTSDEAWRVASNIAKLPDLLKKD